jgi:hypothetical protein
MFALDDEYAFSRGLVPNEQYHHARAIRLR